ncbi:Chromate resistance protein ChrB [Desulfosporosinus sp. FKA]|uniref:Chromate resistance protein ChrB n=1 Tax=Desulfosporosinus sp. FKA TaxID=1969834 RepID=UPI001FA91A63|nr:Chromate resistance protein ChrB [Desulfosporosinus sp. FKA]
MSKREELAEGHRYWQSEEDDILLKWLIMSYNLPSEPSRLRVATWRSLKKLGAVNIHQSLWLLPLNDENYTALSMVASNISENQGEVLLMQTIAMEDSYEKAMISRFNKAREIEYEEIIDKCNDYFAEINKEIERKNFTFAEAEENEEELEKLLSWFEKVKLRDVFASPLREVTEKKLEECRKCFEDFNSKTFENEKSDPPFPIGVLSGEGGIYPTRS